MSQPNPSANRINTLAALLTRICVVVRTYLQQRSLVPLSMIQHFQKQRAMCKNPDTVPEVYVDEDCSVVPRPCRLKLIEERVNLNKRKEEIRSLADEALPIVRTAAPLAQLGIGKSVGQYLTEVAMRLKQIVGTVQVDLDALEIAVQNQVMYAPWMEDWNSMFCEPGTDATDLLKHKLLPKLYDDALRFGSLAMPSESKRSESIDAKQTSAGQEAERDEDRIEPQQAGGASLARPTEADATDRDRRQPSRSPAMSIKQLGKALIMDPYRVFKRTAMAQWELKPDKDARNKWTIDYKLLNDPGKQRQIEEHAAFLRNKEKKSSAT